MTSTLATTKISPVPAVEELMAELPLRRPTAPSWGELAAANLPIFLADHAICEQQAALFGLSLVGHYPEDRELVVHMSALAAEEVAHLRRVITLLHKRELSLLGRRANPWVQGLRKHLDNSSNAHLKVDRLCLGALIEARSCERFTCLLRVVQSTDPEVALLLQDLGPAEKRHWRLFIDLARQAAAEQGGDFDFETRWQGWLDLEDDLAGQGGLQPTVHG
jgi:tRNA-(ms[2]io[6]A)-hydroxylase